MQQRFKTALLAKGRTMLDDHDREAIGKALDELVNDGILISWYYLDHGGHWQLVRNEVGEPYEFSAAEVLAYIAGTQDARDH